MLQSLNAGSAGGVCVGGWGGGGVLQRGLLAVQQVHIPPELKRTMLRSQRRRMSLRGLAAAPGGLQSSTLCFCPPVEKLTRTFEGRFLTVCFSYKESSDHSLVFPRKRKHFSLLPVLRIALSVGLSWNVVTV